MFSAYIKSTILEISSNYQDKFLERKKKDNRAWRTMNAQVDQYRSLNNLRKETHDLGLFSCHDFLLFSTFIFNSTLFLMKNLELNMNR